MAVEEQVVVIWAATNGFVDRILEDKVPDFFEKLVDRARSAMSDTLKAIREGNWGDDQEKAIEQTVSQFADDYGYDLDEEGLPLTDESGHEGSRRGGDDTSEEESERQEETAGAAA